jgi:hypothetical protein
MRWQTRKFFRNIFTLFILITFLSHSVEASESESVIKFELSLHQKLISTLNAEAQWAIKNKLVKSKTIPNYFNFILSEPLNQQLKYSVTVTE